MTRYEKLIVENPEFMVKSLSSVAGSCGVTKKDKILPCEKLYCIGLAAYITNPSDYEGVCTLDCKTCFTEMEMILNQEVPELKRG